MWRLSSLVRLVGLFLYALALAVGWAVWGLLILAGLMLVSAFRLVGVSLAGVERAVTSHRHSWRTALQSLLRVPGHRRG